MLGGSMMMAAGGGIPVALASTGTDHNDAHQQVYTFNPFLLGDADTHRKLALLALDQGGANRTTGVASIVVDDVNYATQVVLHESEDFTQAEIWEIEYPAGTTGKITVNWKGTADKCWLYAFALYDAGAVHATNVADSTGTAVATTTLDIPKYGAAIGVSCVRGSGGTPASTWTGLSEVRDDWWVGSNMATCAAGSFVDAQSALPISVAPDISIHNQTLVVASWKPRVAP